MNQKVCQKCLKKIKAKDDYACVEMFSKGKSISKGYMHKSCNDKINEENFKVINQLNKLSGAIPELLEKVGISSIKEFEIK